MDEIVKEFLVESYENLDQLEHDLMLFEKEEGSPEILANIFRTIHTLKGATGFLGYDKLEHVAHAGENLLSKLRDGVLAVNPIISSVLLSTVDAVRYMLGHIEATNSQGDQDYSDLIEALCVLSEGSTGHIMANNSTPQSPSQVPPIAAPAIAAPPIAIPPPQPASPQIPAVAQPAILIQTAQPATETDSATADFAESHGPKVTDSTIRVDVGLLDKLMNLVGELVLARNQILQHSTRFEDSSLVATSQRLNLITTELQGSIMKTRMQPIGNIWGKLPRVVRDLATTCGKEVRLELAGKETELDKTVIETIKDPLTHIVRNSVDHGIETAAARLANGKPAEGTLSMRAFHEGGQVIIEIADDGAGIDAERIKQKALKSGLITSEHAARMGDHEALRLIFLPGFSTAEKITNVSGRGVGMDVVKTNIEKIGGAVDIHSQVGKGTTLKIKIPLTLAIIPALIVSSGGDRFAIPQVNLLELVRVEDGQIEFIHGAPVYRLRGRLLPLVYLNRELKLESNLPANSPVNIVVLEADGNPFGLAVDEINDTEEIVVKPLCKQLKGVASFAGATIMGDGRVALILDVMGLAQRAGVMAEKRTRDLSEASSTQGRKTIDSRQTLLLFDIGTHGHMAIPLSVVARLEEIPLSNIEHSGAQEVVRYRGQIIPLIRVADHVADCGAAGQETNGAMQVVVYSEQGRSVGLVVGRIRDIVHEAITEKRHSHGNGIFGSIVIQERVTDLLDVKAVIRAADPTFYGDTPADKAA